MNSFFDETLSADNSDVRHSEEPQPERRHEPEELIPELTLYLTSGVGAVLMQRLLLHFKNAESVLNASPQELQRVQGISTKVAENIGIAHSENRAENLVKQCRENNILLISQNDIRYPVLLRKIPDPPPFLFIQGDWNIPDRYTIAMVGTRRATPYGTQQAERLATELVHCGFTIVSGLATGIDGASHRGALAANGRTLAVLGNGLLHIFPQEHQDLARQTAAHGALMSECLPDQIPRRGIFPQRNRIISGLSLGVLVVEAPTQSGALITSSQALKQGRAVFAVPGPAHLDTSRGCHQLIRDNAVLVESADDVVRFLRETSPASVPSVGTFNRPEVLIPLTTAAKETLPKNKPSESLRNSPPAPSPAEQQLGETESNILKLVLTTPTPIDKIIVQSDLPAHQVLATLSMLEVNRLVRRTESNSVVRVF
ncbi:MAG: DNA-processing protein DprA [Planctomycetaceae bacterium]|jgi:DNA processing protein|nr:DNA-processing protein DprA [Planctomycetaceae bacterium]